MAVRIELATCINCGWCRRACPTEAIRYFSTGRRTHVVDMDWCIDCGICGPLCPVGSIFEDAYRPQEQQAGLAKAKARAWARRQYAVREERRTRVATALATLADGG